MNLSKKNLAYLLYSGIYATTAFVTGLITAISFSHVSMGIIIGLAIIGGGVYYGYKYMTVADTTYQQIYYGSITLLSAVGGITSCCTTVNYYWDYGWFARFLIALLILCAISTLAAVNWGLITKRYVGEYISTLGFDEMKQNIFNALSAGVCSLIATIAFTCTTSSPIIGHLILASFIVALISGGIGAAACWYLLKKTSATGYEAPLDVGNDIAIEEPKEKLDDA